ncbi:MAG TPA: hypothetical protein VFP72_14695 [Kineosporiaceae bacterium]|nr:hypothetical protein [Kineosporiaceae bacterium]
MSATALDSLHEVFARLRSQHLTDNELRVSPVCTRVMLRTGVNLRTPTPVQDRDPVLIKKVLDCLAEMGFPLR